MPVQNVGNDIIQAFIAGHQAAQQRQALAYKKEQDATELEQRKKEQADQKKHFEDQLAQAQDQFNVTHKALAVAQEFHQQDLRNKLQEAQGQSSLPLPGYKLANSQSMQTEPGYAGTQNSYIPEDANSSLPDIQSLDPETTARNQAKLLAIALQPKTDEAIRLKQAEDGVKLYEANLAHAARLNEIALQNQGRNEAARIRGEAAAKTKLETPISPIVQRDVFGLKQYDPTLTPSTASGAGLIKPFTETQKNKLADFADLQAKTLKLKALLDKKDASGIDNYAKFYNGLVGGTVATVTSQFGKGTAQELENIGQLATSIESQAKNLVGKYGGALTGNEQALLEKQAPSGNRRIPTNRSRAIVNGFAEQLQNFQDEMIKANAAPSKSNNPNPNNDTEDRVYDPKTGKRIK